MIQKSAIRMLCYQQVPLKLDSKYCRIAIHPNMYDSECWVMMIQGIHKISSIYKNDNVGVWEDKQGP